MRFIFVECANVDKNTLKFIYLKIIFYTYHVA